MSKGIKAKIARIIERDRKNKTILALDGAITVLCVVVVVLLWGACVNIIASRNYARSESSLYYMLAEERYMDLLVASDQNRALGKNQNKTCQEYYAVADYFDASMHYYMYEQAGDEERAKIWKEKQEEAAGRMGSLSYEQSAIQTFLGQE